MSWGTFKQKTATILRTHPRAINAFLLTVTAVQALLVRNGMLSDLWSALPSGTYPERIEGLYTGALAAAAIVSGFSGVVVVFALTADGPRFQRLRVHGGKALKANWMSATNSGFIAVFGFTSATVVSLIGFEQSAPYFFQAGFLLLTHSALRLLWLLGELSEIVVAADKDSLHQARQVNSARELYDHFKK